MEDTNGSVSGLRNVLKAVGCFDETLESEGKMDLVPSMSPTKANGPPRS